VARSAATNGHIFVKTKDGRIFTASRGYREVDLLADFGSNAKDRSVYAKLAGITVKELDDTRKAARDKELKSRRVFDLRRLKSDAAKLGMKVVKA
jgi:hypothetical protein